jgi:hypothetical protein
VRTFKSSLHSKARSPPLLLLWAYRLEALPCPHVLFQMVQLSLRMCSHLCLLWRPAVHSPSCAFNVAVDAGMRGASGSGCGVHVRVCHVRSV